VGPQKEHRATWQVALSSLEVHRGASILPGSGWLPDSSLSERFGLPLLSNTLPKQNTDEQPKIGDCDQGIGAGASILRRDPDSEVIAVSPGPIA
jgi:hypothetical protein